MDERSRWSATEPADGGEGGFAGMKNDGIAAIEEMMLI